MRTSNTLMQKLRNFQVWDEELEEESDLFLEETLEEVMC